MKRKFSFLGVGLALVLVLSLCLTTAVPAAAEPGDTYAGYTLGGTAQWSTTEEHSGVYSVKLSASGHYVEFVPQAGIKFSDLADITTGWSFWYYSEDIGPGLELRFTGPNYNPDNGGAEHVDITVNTAELSPTTAVWHEEDITSSSTATCYGNDGENDAFYDGDWSPGTSTGNLTLSELVDAVTALFEDPDWDGSSDPADWEFTRVRAEVYGSGTVYIDDITINDTTYELEPIFLDTAHPYFYKTGATIGVTVPNFNANGDPVRVDEVNVTAKSTTDTVGLQGDNAVVLTETGVNTGVFTGSFPTTGTIPPGAGELAVSDSDTITVTYNGEADWGAGIQSTDITATVDDTLPTITGLTPEDGAIDYDITPEISANYNDGAGSGIDTDSVVMTVNGVDVTSSATVTESDVTYTSVELPAGSTVEVTVDVSDNVENAAETASWSFTIASALNVGVDPATLPAGSAGDLVVTITGVDTFGPDGAGTNALDWAKVEVSVPVGNSWATGEWAGEDTGDPLGDAVYVDTDTIKFVGLLPNDASSDITVTVTGELDGGTPVGPVEKTVEVTGYKVIDLTPSTDQIVGTISDISTTITTKGDLLVNSAVVHIHATQAGGFMKDILDDEGKESFQHIFIIGPLNQIAYDDDSDPADPIATEDFVVNNGYYEVTGIEFAQLGPVVVGVSATGTEMAFFPVPFSVIGEEVYTLSFEPTKLTVGVDGIDLEITITEDGTPVTDVTAITVDGVPKGFTQVDNVYTVTAPLLYTEEKTLTVVAKNDDATKWGDASLEVALPAVSYVITDASDIERTLMLTSEEYTVSLTVTDAVAEPLDGFLWIGTYDEETGVFDSHAGPVGIESGTGEFDTTAPGDPATLVWKVGGSTDLEDAALLLEPAIAVEDLYYDVNPEEATVDVQTTYTVTDNYLDVAGNQDVKIVTPAGDVVNKITTPLGTFKYTAPEVGDYYVSVKLDPTWQAPITVTVSVPLVYLESIAAEPSEVSLDVGETQPLTVTATYSDESTADVKTESSYESSATSVATVSTGGLITAVAEGSATITASYTEAEITRTAEVSVTVGFDPMVYDADGDGVISKTEAVEAVWDYFDGVITKEQAIEVLWLYFG